MTISRDKCYITKYPSITNYTLSTSGVPFDARARWNNGNIGSIVVNIANPKLEETNCIEYIGISVRISPDKCDITESPSITNYT